MAVGEDGLIHGIADGWVYFVDARFIRPLDIAQTPTIDEGLQWTQGSAFCFDEGVTIYDTPNGYQPWGEALKSIRAVIQVKKGMPATPAIHVSGKWERSDKEAAREQEASLTSQGYTVELKYKPNARRWFWILEADYPRFPGQVEFVIKRPNAARDGLSELEFHTMTQDEFIVFLMTGNIRA